MRHFPRARNYSDFIQNENVAVSCRQLRLSRARLRPHCGALCARHAAVTDALLPTQRGTIHLSSCCTICEIMSPRARLLHFVPVLNISVPCFLCIILWLSITIVFLFLRERQYPIQSVSEVAADCSHKLSETEEEIKCHSRLVLSCFIKTHHIRTLTLSGIAASDFNVEHLAKNSHTVIYSGIKYD